MRKKTTTGIREQIEWIEKKNCIQQKSTATMKMDVVCRVQGMVQMKVYVWCCRLLTGRLLLCVVVVGLFFFFFFILCFA